MDEIPWVGVVKSGGGKEKAGAQRRKSDSKKSSGDQNLWRPQATTPPAANTANSTVRVGGWGSAAKPPVAIHEFGNSELETVCGLRPFSLHFFLGVILARSGMAEEGEQGRVYHKSSDGKSLCLLFTTLPLQIYWKSYPFPPSSPC